jgi:hypothetical protein
MVEWNEPWLRQLLGTSWFQSHLNFLACILPRVPESDLRRGMTIRYGRVIGFSNGLGPIYDFVSPWPFRASFSIICSPGPFRSVEGIDAVYILEVKFQVLQID